MATRLNHNFLRGSLCKLRHHYRGRPRIACRLLLGVVPDAAGHESPNFRLAGSWLPQRITAPAVSSGRRKKASSNSRSTDSSEKRAKKAKKAKKDKKEEKAG